jgi:DNA polymerase-3 subunit alpha
LTWDASQTAAPTNFVEKLTEILQPFRGGECPIIIEYTASSAKVTVQLGEDWRVKPSDELLIRMRRLLSTESVLVKYKA